MSFEKTESIEKQRPLLLENATKQQEKIQTFFSQVNQKSDLSLKKLKKQIASQVNPQEVAALLKWVTEGHLEEAEKLLQKNPNLALAKGTVKDLSDRTFENITAFQLSVWYLDTEMWEILLKYMDKSQVALQLDALENDRKDIHQKHGKHFDLAPLIKEYQMYIDNYSKWSSQQREEHLCKKMGGEQRKLPAWFIYAFCEKGQNKAWPTRDFSKTVKREYGESHVLGWYTTKHNDGVLGDKFAYVRGSNLMPLLLPAHLHNVSLFRAHDRSMSQLLKSRQEEQLGKLQASLIGVVNVGKPLEGFKK